MSNVKFCFFYSWFPGKSPGGAGCPQAAHGSHMEQISTLQPVEEPPVEQVDVAWRRLWPMESPRRSRPRAGAAARGQEPMQEQGVWGELPPTRGGPVLEQFAPGGWMDPVVRSHVGAVLEELLPAGSPRRLSSGRTASRGRDPTWSRGRGLSPRPYLNP